MAGKSVLVTGCSDGGLGAGLALAFHNKGYRVIASARNVSKMADLKSRGIETVTLDVVSEDSIKKCVAHVSDLLDGKLDLLVNNAGAGYSMPIMDIKLDAIRSLFELNVFSLISVTQAFLPLLRKSTAATVVNHTSVASVLGPPFHSAYNASKAAAAMLTNNLRLELEPFGIKVVDLKTAVVKTNFFANVGAANLPPNSIYAPARDVVTEFIRGGDIMDNVMTADTWAKQVVDDLARPPYVIWRGSQSTILWLATFLPIWLLDSTLKKITGIATLERRLKAQDAGLKQA